MSSACYGELPLKSALSAYERHALAQDPISPASFTAFPNMPASSSTPTNNPMAQTLDAPLVVPPKSPSDSPSTQSVTIPPPLVNGVHNAAPQPPNVREDQASPILDAPPSFGPLSPANNSGLYGTAGGAVPSISELDTSPAYGPAKPIPVPVSSSSPSLSAISHSPIVLAVDTQSVSENAPPKSFVCDRQTISDLMNFFIKFQSALGSPRSTPVLRSAQDQVNELFSRDYNIAILKNESGEYCNTYPMDVVIIESVKRGIPKIDSSGFAVKVNDANVLKHLFKSSRYTRVHGRFVIPAILVRNKNIARSSTLSVYGETLLNHFTTKSREFIGSFYGSSSSAASSSSESTSTSVSFAVDQEAQRRADVLLLTKLGMKYICDLMVENRKKKLGLTVTSSEKVESHRYSKFKINVIPYPGCEFFKVFKESNYNGHEVKFDWTQSFVNAQLSVALESARTFSWDKYREWDIVSLTKNYIQLLLELLGDPEDDSGLLVHCISGWDRTPLFISLLRLSLWADGECHQSLNAHEILYLTLAYDWMLFCHQLSNRLAKGEDLFYFCFYFLQFITGPEFALPNRVAAVQPQFQQQQTRQQAVSVSSASSSSASAMPSPNHPNHASASPSPLADGPATLSLAEQEALRELSPGLSDASSSVMVQASAAMPSFPNGSSPVPATTASPVAGSPPSATVASLSLSHSQTAYTSPGASPDLRAASSVPSASTLQSSRSPQHTSLESPPNLLTQHFAAPTLSQNAGTSPSSSSLAVAASGRTASIHPRPITNGIHSSKKQSVEPEPSVFRVGSYEAVWTPANGAIPFDIESSSDTEGSPINPRRSSLVKEAAPKEMSSHRTTTHRAFADDDSDGENAAATGFDDSEEDVTADMEMDGDPVFKRSPTKKANSKPASLHSDAHQTEMNGHSNALNHHNGITKPGSPGQTSISKSRSNHSAFGSPKLGGISAAVPLKQSAAIPIATGPPPRAFSGSAAVSTRPSSTPIDIPSGMAPRARSDVPPKAPTRPREPDGSDAEFRTGSWQMVFDEHMDSRSVPGSVPRSLSRRTSNPLQVVFQQDELNFPAPPTSTDSFDHTDGTRANGVQFPPLTGLTLTDSNRAHSPFEDPLGVTNGELPTLMAQSVAHEPISGNATIEAGLSAPTKRPWDHEDISPVPTEDSPFIRPDLPTEQELKPLVAADESSNFSPAAPLLLQRVDPDELEEEDPTIAKQPTVPITASASPDGPVLASDGSNTQSSASISSNPSPFESPLEPSVEPPQSLRAQRLMEVHNLFMSLYHHHVIAPAAAAAAAVSTPAPVRPEPAMPVAAELARCSTPSSSLSPTPTAGSPPASNQQSSRATGFGYGLLSYFYPSNSGS